MVNKIDECNIKFNNIRNEKIKEYNQSNSFEEEWIDECNIKFNDIRNEFIL